ncbi:hypothetical protein [uncultured Neptuniibacter sp.]|uniref:hypothetical protein n=1 Tax=uncultured Neptuniibacter sp. TaxID=502143 RepID=UPI00262BB4A7|nr:hypothetical protein [uncultured Neptuniibacter sp.]
MYCLKQVGILLVAVTLTGCQIKPENTEPEKLSPKEVSSLFIGKTVESFNLISGSTSFTYYHPDGSVEQERYWEKRNGFWKINDKGEICLAMQGKPFSCRSIYREGEKFYKYRLVADGKPEKVIRYRQFIDGRTF